MRAPVLLAVGLFLVFVSHTANAEPLELELRARERVSIAGLGKAGKARREQAEPFFLDGELFELLADPILSGRFDPEAPKKERFQPDTWAGAVLEERILAWIRMGALSGVSEAQSTDVTVELEDWSLQGKLVPGESRMKVRVKARFVATASLWSEPRAGKFKLTARATRGVAPEHPALAFFQAAGPLPGAIEEVGLVPGASGPANETYFLEGDFAVLQDGTRIAIEELRLYQELQQPEPRRRAARPPVYSPITPVVRPTTPILPGLPGLDPGLDPGIIDPYLPPIERPPVETVPRAPRNVHVHSKTSTRIRIHWGDLSAVEDGFDVERQENGRWVRVSTRDPILGASNEGGYWVRNLLPGTEYCLRVVPWNHAYGRNESVQQVCTTTTRGIGPMTVLVDDLPGLIGELGDDTLPPVKGGSLGDLVVAERAPAPGIGSDGSLRARKIVYVDDDADIDVFRKVTVRQGFHLVSGRSGLRQGALLRTRTASPMIVVEGNDVRIAGLRFEGPSPTTSKQVGKSTGILVSDSLDVVIEGNEFYHWTGSGVEVEQAPRPSYAAPRPIDFDRADRVRVTRNFFHHNQRQNAGYGVVLSLSAYAWIDGNTFDYNRHAIASTGGRKGYPGGEDAEVKTEICPAFSPCFEVVEYPAPEHGFRAYHNLVLPGHSKQDAGPIHWQTHHFDVHGFESNWLGVDYYDGWAGERFDVARNSFLGIKGTAFNVRGTPADEARFRFNVTPALLPIPGTGIYVGMDGGRSYYGWTSVKDSSDEDNVRVYGNVPLEGPRRELGVGDFDGDGRDDVFLATGRSWFVSFGGRTEWRFRNESDRQLYELVLMDQDGDGRTDVLTRDDRDGRWLISRGGSGELESLGRASVPTPASPYDRGDLVGDFTGDGTNDRLEFEPTGDRYFYVEDGRSGETIRSRHKM